MLAELINIMGKFVEYNPNPNSLRSGDCVIRALSKALNQDWYQTYLDLSVEGLLQCDWGSANHVWGAYLRHKGFSRSIIPNNCPDCYTVEDFCDEHPRGTYILAISGHVVCVSDGHFYDSWYSGNEHPIYFWYRKDDK